MINFQEAKAKNICRAESVEIPEKATPEMYENAVDVLIKKNDSKVIIAFVRTEDAKGLLDAATRRNLSSR